MTIGDKILDFLANVRFDGDLPTGIEVMMPYSDSKEVWEVCKAFYQKYYNAPDFKNKAPGFAIQKGIPNLKTVVYERKCKD